MNRLSFLFALLFIALLPLAAQDKAPLISFNATSHDFGSIHEEDGPVTCSFSFVNNGDAPLVIISATAQCGCTRPSFPQKPINPANQAKLKSLSTLKAAPANLSKKSKSKPTIRNTAPPNSKSPALSSLTALNPIPLSLIPDKS